MDASSIGALTGTAEASKKKKQGSSPGDGDAFASVMGQASESESDGDKKADLISKEESAKEKADKAEDKKRQAAKDAGGDPRAKESKDRHAKGNVNEFLKNIDSKDPATLSMAQRMSHQLGEFAPKTGNSMTGMAKMLASQGIDMSGFSPQQIMSLVSRMDTKELGKMMTQMKEMGVKLDEDTLKGLKEQLNSTNQNNNSKETSNFQMEGFLQSGLPKEAGEANRAEQRRAVMDQLLTKIQVRNVANQTEMQLRLNPEYLGEVKISLIHDDEGGVRATFTTTSKVTKEILSENKLELMDQASDRGVRIGSMDVEYVDEITG
jgi:hypothetical protein